MLKATVYSLYTCGPNVQLHQHDGWLLEQGCAVYRCKPGVWRVIDIYTGVRICDGESRTKAIGIFRAKFLGKLVDYRAAHAEDYKARVCRCTRL